MDFYIVQFLTGLASASSLFLVACGLSLIFGVTRIVNFAHGSFYMLGAYFAYTISAKFFGNSFPGFIGSVVFASIIVGAIGIFVELVLLRRIYHAPELFQLIATFGVVLVVKDVTRMGWGSEDYFWALPAYFAAAIDIGDQKFPVRDLFMIGVGPLVLGLMWLLLRKTRWGTLVRAATQDRDIVGVLGVNQKLLFTSVFFVGAVLAGLGGAIQLPRESIKLDMDLNIIAAAFVVVVVGGMGSMGGAFLAAFLIAELNAFAILVFPKLTLVIMFLVMAVVLVFRPWGLLGKAETGAAHNVALEAPLRPAEPRLKLLYLIVALALIALPALGPGTVILAIDILILVLFAASLHFIMGPGGMVSFGHAAYFGLGAYGAALMVKFFAVPMEFGIVAGAIAAAFGAFVFGWFAVRLAGVYLAMLTLAFAQIVWSVIFQWNEATGGEDGILSIRPSSWAANKLVYYYLTLLLCIGGAFLLRRILYAPFGYTMRAGRDSPRRADAIGIDVRRHQWFAFTIAGAFAGIAGVLHVYAKGSVFPTVMDIPHSIDALMMVLFGGVQTLGGPLVGAAAYEWLRDTISNPKFWNLIGIGFFAKYWQAGLGLIIIVIATFFPQGIAGFLRDKVGTWLGFVKREELIGGGKS
ncbi:MAG: ABC transporter permease [Alphaproteobacteria bacterium]